MLACMIEPLAPDETSRLLKRLSPNGTAADYLEACLTRVGTTDKVELRQMREGGAQRSVYLTLENWNELRELGEA